jgi:hypothetical protein
LTLIFPSVGSAYPILKAVRLLSVHFSDFDVLTPYSRCDFIGPTISRGLTRHGKILHEAMRYYMVFHEIELNPGEQYMTSLNTSHWLQVSDEGAIVSKFSSTNRNEFDSFRDLGMKLIPEIGKD